MKEDKQPTASPANRQRFEHLLAYFSQLSKSANELLRITHADFNRIMPDLKRSGETVGHLQRHVNALQLGSTQPGYLALKESISQSYVAIGQSTVHIQFFDIIQQQLQHLEQTLQEQELEVKALVEEVANPAEVAYLYALPELLCLQTGQLAEIESYYFGQLSECKEKSLHTMVHLQWMASHVVRMGNEALFRKSVATKALFSAVYELVFEELIRFRPVDYLDEDHHPFQRTVAAMQRLLIEVAAQYQGVKPEENNEVKGALLKRVRARYTMQRELELHDRLLSKLANSESPPTVSSRLPDHDIELF